MKAICLLLTRSTFLLLCGLLLPSCASLQPGDFAKASPKLEPDKYFEGPVRSWGVIETRSGAPRTQLRATLFGQREGQEMVLTQDFTFADGRTLERVWRFRRREEGRYSATADGVIGAAVGIASGNSFHWEYMLELRPGNPLSRVRMQHWMYLLDDGETLLNRVVIRKFGIVVGQVTEYFRKGTGVVPDIGTK